MNRILLVLSVLLLASCEYYGFFVEEDYSDYEAKVYNVPSIDYRIGIDETPISVYKIAQWIAWKIVYVSDADLYGKSEYWATPDETYWNMAGDCEDDALLLMYLLHRDMGLESKLIIGKVIYQGVSYGHAWVEVNGEWWESVGGIKISDRSLYKKDRSFSYADAMGTATEARSLVGIPAIN